MIRELEILQWKKEKKDRLGICGERKEEVGKERIVQRKQMGTESLNTIFPEKKRDSFCPIKNGNHPFLPSFVVNRRKAQIE